MCRCFARVHSIRDSQGLSCPVPQAPSRQGHLEIPAIFSSQALMKAALQGGIEEKFKLIVEAYSVLSDENSRADYDAGRSAQRQNPYSDDSYSYSDDDDC